MCRPNSAVHSLGGVEICALAFKISHGFVQQRPIMADSCKGLSVSRNNASQLTCLDLPVLANISQKIKQRRASFALDEDHTQLVT